MLKWRVGDVTITRIVEWEGPAMPGGFPFATPDALRQMPWLSPHFVDAKGQLLMSIHALLIETPIARLIVDTCIGNDKPRPLPQWNDLQGEFLKDLETAGCPRESIDFVVCTHLHVDHIGWNTMLVDGVWKPTFPNARYLIGKDEYSFWSSRPTDKIENRPWGFEDSVVPILESGLADFVASDHRVTEEVSLEPTPGHTPGHVSVRIRSKGEEALITGDFLHHPCQFTHPEWTTSVDNDPEATVSTRRRVFASLETDHALVIGTHFPKPTAGRLTREGDAWRFEV